MSRQACGFRLRDWICQLEAQGKVAPEKPQIRYGGIPLKPLYRTFGNRFLVIGDAAGQVKPTTGGGIYFGLICADIAADTLNEALLAGDLSSRKLSGYQRKWREKLAAELRREYLARRLYEHLSDRQINGLFSRLKSTGIVESLLQEESLSFDWHGGLLLKALRLGTLAQARRWLKYPLGLARR